MFFQFEKLSFLFEKKSSRRETKYFNWNTRFFNRNTKFFDRNTCFFDRNTRFLKHVWQMNSIRNGCQNHVINFFFNFKFCEAICLTTNTNKTRGSILLWPKSFNSLSPNAPFPYLMKTENRKVFWCFQGDEKMSIENKSAKLYTLLQNEGNAFAQVNKYCLVLYLMLLSKKQISSIPSSQSF